MLCVDLARVNRVGEVNCDVLMLHMLQGRRSELRPAYLPRAADSEAVLQQTV